MVITMGKDPDRFRDQYQGLGQDQFPNRLPDPGLAPDPPGLAHQLQVHNPD